jgi:hypothetical protein
MANELLDFVMSLVRDPDAAARYAGNPQQAIADAHLANVTSVDVNNLIPVVSESLSMATPVHGADANVWSSGAATAAFDAFSDHQPTPAVVETHQAVIEAPSESPVGVGADQWHDPGPDLHTFDAGTLDDPFGAAVHDVGPAVDPGVVDPAFEHSGHSGDHLGDHQGFADPGPGHDAPGFDTPHI